MTPASTAHDGEEIWQVLKKINLAWLHGHCAKGGEACVGSYKDFVSQVRVREYRDCDPDVHLWGSTAVATYSWEIAYEMKGESYSESGRDVFVFVRENARRLVVWRTILRDVIAGG